MNKLRTVIVDDHPIVIEGLKNLLSNENNIEIAGTFCNGQDLLSYLNIHSVDLILLDITLPDSNGMELCKLIKQNSIHTMILMISNHTERSIILETIQNGASGYLLKNSTLDELRHCIAEALKGNICYSREQQILGLLAKGKTSQVIGQELFLSPLTVDTHRRNLIQKFAVKNVAELIMAANQQKIL
jgi:DNA-binding NarL/FixJ family response regulator